MTTIQKFDAIVANLPTEDDLRVAVKVAMLIGDHALAQMLREHHEMMRSMMKAGGCPSEALPPPADTSWGSSSPPLYVPRRDCGQTRRDCERNPNTAWCPVHDV